MKTQILKCAVVLLLWAGGLVSCGEEKENGETELLTPCNLQTKHEGNIENMDVKFFKEYPENIEQYNQSSFICERDGSTFLYVINGSFMDSYGICNFPQSVKNWIIPADGIFLVISGKVFDRDAGYHPPEYKYYNLELTSLTLKRK
ncbi:MAG: hypothetical protein LBG28_13715 [Tannerella sp.]|jgi:hypothetical protein|nr:hypothetical protein [Tannerella sp.]